jgi:SAM-dependent methyltransferase
MTSELSQAWGRHAQAYARFGAPFTGYIAQALFHTVAGRLPPAPEILEVACGNGELSRAAALHCLAEQAATGRTGRVVATDFAAEMVGLAARTLESIDAGDLARCEVQDGQALSFAAGAFDAVFSAFGILLFPDRRAGWREAARVLRPGGLLGTAVWRGPEDNPLARLQMEPIMAALPERVRAALPRPGWLDIASPRGLADELVDAGFADVEISVFDAVLTLPTPRAMWEIMRENPVTQAVFARLSEDELEAVAQAVLSRYEALAGRPDRALRLPSSCHFAVARRA